MDTTTIDHSLHTNPGCKYAMRPLAGLVAPRFFSLVGLGLAETDLSPAATVASNLTTALQSGLKRVPDDAELPAGCALLVKQVELVETHQVGAAIFLVRLSELLPVANFDAVAKTLQARYQHLIKSALAARGVDRRQLDLGLDAAEDRATVASFAEAFGEKFASAADLQFFDPSTDSKLRLLHIDAIPHARQNASGGSLGTYLGMVVGFKANKTEISFKLAGGGGTIQVEFRHDLFAAKLLLLYLATQPCEVDIVVTNFQDTGTSAAKTKYTLSQINLALEHDWGPILDACIAAKEFLTRNSVAPAEWGSTNMTGAGNGRGASAHNLGSHGDRHEKSMGDLHVAQKPSGGLTEDNGNAPTLLSPKSPRRREKRQPL